MEIICKKYFRSGGENIYAEYIKGTQYRKFLLENNLGSFRLRLLDPLVTNKHEIYFIYVYSLHGGHRFRTRKKDYNSPSYLPYFYDYFYNENEIRKLKLKKLNQL